MDMLPHLLGRMFQVQFCIREAHQDTERLTMLFAVWRDLMAEFIEEFPACETQIVGFFEKVIIDAVSVWYDEPLPVLARAMLSYVIVFCSDELFTSVPSIVAMADRDLVREVIELVSEYHHFGDEMTDAAQVELLAKLDRAFLFCATLDAHATHICGSVLTYVCLDVSSVLSHSPDNLEKELIRLVG